MPTANSLQDLLRIRDANREYIESINGNLGSALGFKKRTNEEVSDEPAILVFVPRKIHPKWLPASQLIVKKLEGPNDLTCPVDVVEGGRYEDTYLWSHDRPTGADRLISWQELQGVLPLGPKNIELRDVLRGWTEKVSPGCQLAGFDREGMGYYGTLGCFARDVETEALGFITNQHVADQVGNLLWFPEHHARPIGTARRSIEVIRDDERFVGLVDEPAAFFRMDSAFCELRPEVGTTDLEPRIPFLDQDGNLQPRLIGDPLQLDLATMGPVGLRVLGVGRTRSLQRGIVAGFAYEWADETNESHYTDILIVGEPGDEFSDHGDSGKLIVTDDDNMNAVALLWGGWRERLRRGREQENWSYAIDINAVVNLLGVEIVSQLS